MTNAEYLRAKADGVHDIYKWLQNLYKQNRECHFGAPSSREVMVGIEKYKKKLKHEADEAERGY